VFAALAAMPSVLLTRSLKETGSPTVASRWVLRIKQLAKGLVLESKLNGRNDLLMLARVIDESARDKRVRRPAPCPPVDARPRQLSVTQIETWLRDPYAIYARHVLKLKPLDPIDVEPGARERGVAIHKALERFLSLYPAELPPDAHLDLLRIGDEEFKKRGATSAVLALWRPRFERAARWFIAYERERRRHVTHLLVEAVGKIEIPARLKFTLTGRADRIDWFANGSASLVDYKTGRTPSDKQIEALLAPQLPLEAAMLLQGGFNAPQTSAVSELVHVRLTGADPPGAERIAKVEATAKAAEALAKLTALVALYDEQSRGYRSREMPFSVTDIGDYDHLARVREWTRGEEEE